MPFRIGLPALQFAISRRTPLSTMTQPIQTANTLLIGCVWLNCRIERGRSVVLDQWPEESLEFAKAQDTAPVPA